MIIGLKFSKILFEKNSSKEKTKNPIKNISTKTDITDITDEKIEVKDKAALNLNFKFFTNYEPDIANISIEGSALFLSTPDKAKEILNTWKKQDMPQDFKIEVLNYIMAKCNIKVLSMIEDFNLPPQIPLPRFQHKEKEKPANNPENKANYTG